MNRNIANCNIAIECGFLSLFFTGFCLFLRHKHGYDTSFSLMVIPFLVWISIGYLNKFCIFELKDTKHKNKFVYLIKLFLYFLIAIRLIGVGWGSGYLTPLFEAQYQSGYAHIDTLFHSALSNMIINYKISSIGVEGLTYIPYHFFSHIIIGGVGKLLGYGAWESYHLLFIPLFYPLMIGVIQVLSKKISEIWGLETSSPISDIISLLMTLIMFTGLLPDEFRKNLGIHNSSLISESYFIAIVLLYIISIITIALFQNNTKSNLYIFFYLFITTIILSTAKISVGIIFFLFWLFYMLFNKFNLNRIVLLASAGSGLLCALLFAYRKRDIISGGNGISLFHFEKNFVSPFLWTWYIFLYYFLVMVVITLIDITKRHSKIQLKYWNKVILIIFMLMITGGLPGFLIKSASSNSVYFSDIVKWICLPIVISLLSYLFSKYFDFIKFVKVYKGVSIVILVIAISATFSIKGNIDGAYNNYSKSILLYTSYSDYKLLLKSLENLKKLKGENNVAIFDIVPTYGREAITDKRTYMRSFLSVPAISGMPLINEVEKYLINAEGPYNYGFDKLMETESKDYIDFNVIKVVY